MERRPRTACDGSELALRLQHLAPAIHPRLEIDVMRPVQLAGLLVLDIGRLGHLVAGTPHPAPGRRGLFLRHSHRSSPTHGPAAGGPEVAAAYTGRHQFWPEIFVSPSRARPPRQVIDPG